METRDPAPTQQPNTAAMAWPELVTAAVLGTERHALSGTSTIDASELLDVIAGRVAARRAGRLPDPPVIATDAPDDDRADAPAAAIALLGELLAVGPIELVELWVQRVNHHGRRPPGEHLVALANTPRALAQLHERDLDRLDWLAEQMPELRLKHRRSVKRPVNTTSLATAISITPPLDATVGQHRDDLNELSLTQLTVSQWHEAIAAANSRQLDAITRAVATGGWSAAQLRLADQLIDSLTRRRRLDVLLPPDVS
jgi:hypothetical protein